MPLNRTPTYDGESIEFTPAVFDISAWPAASRPALEGMRADERPTRWEVIFINGIATTSTSHVSGARRVASILNHMVRGVYNMTGTNGRRPDTIGDLVQSARDYLLRVSPRTNPSLHKRLAREEAMERREAGRAELRSNPAAVALYSRLYDNAASRTPTCIVCHSQGNLITSNALFVLKGLTGSVGQVRVFGLASPAPNWPENDSGGLKVWIYNDRRDKVTWLSRPSTTPSSDVKGTDEMAGDGWSGYHDLDHYLSNPAFLEQIRRELRS